MGKMVEEKEKAAQLATTTMEVIPLTVVPITTLATTTTETGKSTKQLARSMENMNLQIEEIKRLETQVNVLQDQIKRTESAHSV